MLNARDLPLVAVFAAVARNGSFTAAARELGFTKSMVSAQLRMLEAKYEVRLLDRTTRSVRLTSVGAAAFAAAERMLSAARGVDDAVSAHREQPTGRFVIGMPHGLAATVAAVVAALIRDHPGISVEMVVDDALQDLVDKRLDVVIRIGAPKDSAYVIRRMSESAVILVAAAGLGLPPAARPADLQGAPWVRYAPVHPGDRWTFTGPRGERETVRPTVRATANTMDAFLALVLAGAGVGVIPEVHVVEELRRGNLTRVCVGWERKRVVIFGLVAGPRVPLHIAAFLRALSLAFGPTQGYVGARRL